MDLGTQSQTYAMRVGSSKPIKTRLVALDLTSATSLAWDHMRHWVSVMDLSDGVKRVLCTPRTSKAGVNHWVWGYHTTEGTIVWRRTKQPL